MAQKARTPLPKKSLILVTVVIVAVVVVILLASVKPPQISLEVKNIRRLPGDKVNLTLSYTSHGSNITTGQYKLRLVARRTIGTAEEKKTLLETSVPAIGPGGSTTQTLQLDVDGFTDLNIYVLKGSKQLIFKTQRIPIS